MKIVNLWTQQTPWGNDQSVLKKDISEGRVPELPYYIAGQQSVKDCISSMMLEIDGASMQTLILRAEYGAGKTNMLKYLDLFFRQHTQYGVKVLYQNTNVEQRDLFMVLLRMLQLHYLEADLLPAIKHIRENRDVINGLVDNFSGEFVCVREYVDHLFSKENDDEKIRELLLVGTGQLYSVRVQRKIGLQQVLNNFDRRCVLVLLLNILSYEKKYVIFALDEVENMYNVSKKRMSLFLTTFRDLVDKFTFIKGHLLMLSITRSVEINVLNSPLYDRIHNYIIDMNSLKEKNDVLDLLHFLQHDIIGSKKSEADLEKISRRISNSLKHTPYSTRELMRTLVAELRGEKKFEGLHKYFEEHPNMKELYDESKRFLILDDVMSDVAFSLFDPLEYYLESLGYVDVKSNLKRRDYQAYIDIDNHSAIMFTFNNLSKIAEKITTMSEVYGIEKVFLFISATNGEISHATLQKIPVSVELVEYEASDLLVLLDMYKNHFEEQEKIADLIHQYTHDVL